MRSNFWSESVPSLAQSTSVPKIDAESTFMMLHPLQLHVFVRFVLVCPDSGTVLPHYTLARNTV